MAPQEMGHSNMVAERVAQSYWRKVYAAALGTLRLERSRESPYFAPVVGRKLEIVIPAMQSTHAFNRPIVSVQSSQASVS